MPDNDVVYFAAKESNAVASVLESKAQEWTAAQSSNGFLEKLRSMYSAYHGAYYSDTSTGHQVTFGGEQGELVNFPVNQFRNIATHMLVMTTSNRPSLECRATNTDYKSQVQTYLANSILDYYLREKKLEVFLKQAVEYAIVYGSGFVVMEWDATRGEVVDYIEETKTKIYEGDILFENLSPFDVMFDGTKESGNNDWVMIRKWKNKFDLAAKYPEYANEIIHLETKSEMEKFRLGISNLLDKTDDVQVFEFYHNRTECMPDGRYMMFLTSDIILQDVAMPYRTLPVFRIAPSNIHGTPHGYTPMFDLLPLQEILNSLYSTVATNQNAFGVQNILNPRGTDIAVNQLIGGLNIIDYNSAAGKPEALNLTQTPAEVFKFIQMVEQAMETLSGVNSVARGQPEASLKSGTALALVQSMALQFMSGLQQSYVELIESVGTAIIKMLQDFAVTPRIVAIAGKTNRSYMKEFSSKDIENISRVAVDVGNPMARTTAGRVQMAEQLLQYGQITARQYVNLIHTGSLDAITEDVVHENMLMRAENESLLDGESPIAIFTESHKDHIDSHRSVLFDPDLKKDPGLVQRVQAHIQQHVELLRTTDPGTLAMLNQQSLPPAPPPPGSVPPPGAAPQGPPGPGGAPGGPPQGGPPPPGLPPGAQMPPQQGQMGPGIAGGRMQGPGIEQGVKLPNLPKVSGALLPNAALQQQSLNNLKK
jgi:hypothetical protein